MSSLRRLHGVFRPQAFLLAPPRADPINEGVFPLAILGLLDLPNEDVEDVGESFRCGDKLLEVSLIRSRGRFSYAT